MGKETKRILKAAAMLLAILTATACAGRQTSVPTAEGGDTIPMRHARNLCMIRHAGYTEAVIRNPWDTTRILNRYILAEDRETDIPTAGTRLNVPLRKAVVFSGVHCALLQELGCQDAIGGVCELKYIHIPYIQEGVREGRIADMGNGTAPNTERIMELMPDVLMPNVFENNGGFGRLERMGIPIVGCAEYMETSPLAQAEWMRFYGRLFGKGERADSLFACIEKEYLALRHTAESVKEKPVVINEVPHSGKWFVAAGESTMGQMYQDAGAAYAFAHIPGSGSVALSIEEVLEKAVHADLWMIKRYGSATRKQLTDGLPGLHRIKASMWLCDTQTSRYFEETPFHPEWLLKNLIQIFHPELNIKTDKTYFQPIE